MGLNCSSESGNRRFITPAGSERDPRGVPGSRGSPLARARSPLRTATAGTGRLPAEAEREQKAWGPRRQLAARPRQVLGTSVLGARRKGRVCPADWEGSAGQRLDNNWWASGACSCQRYRKSASRFKCLNFLQGYIQKTNSALFIHEYCITSRSKNQSKMS